MRIFLSSGTKCRNYIIAASPVTYFNVFASCYIPFRSLFTSKRPTKSSIIYCSILYKCRRISLIHIEHVNCLGIKVEVKFLPRTGHEGPEGEQMYSSTLPSTSTLDGVGDQRHAQATLPPGKDPVPIVQEAGWAPGPVWTGVENLATTGIRSPDRPSRSESLYRLSYPGPRLPRYMSIYRSVNKINYVELIRVINFLIVTRILVT